MTTYCDFPPEARKLPKIGGFTNPSLETILAMQPDVVIGVTTAYELARDGHQVTVFERCASAAQTISCIW